VLRYEVDGNVSKRICSLKPFQIILKRVRVKSENWLVCRFSVYELNPKITFYMPSCYNCACP
jgi:hypothetical protein